MIYPGTDLKFRVTATIDGFTLSDNQFEITIKNRWGQVVTTITKDQCFQDSEERWYFIVENVRSGKMYASFTGAINDDDYQKQVRIVTDYQILCEVGTACTATTSATAHQVQYEQVWTANIDGTTYLADSDGQLVTAADGRRIAFTQGSSRKVTLDMTGDEFKTLIEGRTDDGKINTVPEMEDYVNDDANSGVFDGNNLKL